MNKTIAHVYFILHDESYYLEGYIIQMEPEQLKMEVVSVTHVILQKISR